MQYFVPCGRGLEYLLADELLALGADKATAAQSGVNVEGEAESLLRCALWSRFGSRALWPAAARALCGRSPRRYAEMAGGRRL